MSAEPLDGLAQRLAASGDEVTLAFAELDVLVGGLPERAWNSRYFWSNKWRPDAAAPAWLDAGFRVAAVELQGFVTLVRVRDRLARLEVLRADGGADAVTGTLTLVDGAVEADEGAAWLLEDGFYAALPDGSSPCRVRPGDGPAFLVACWFSLREPGARGRLIDISGHELTPEEERTLVDSLGGTGTIPGPHDAVPGTGPSWSDLPLRAPDLNEGEWDLDAAPLRDAMLTIVAAANERAAAELPEPVPPVRPTPPTGGGWRKGREVTDAARRGMRVFHEWHGLGTVLSVVPQHHKTEALVRFDTGSESWCLVFSLLVETAQ